jgi:precorrin-2 dehydrogenase/sirohydrochlorin ferrochelatase
MLQACGAAVTVVSPQVTPELAELARQGQIQWKQRAFRSTDLRDAFLVIGATDDQGLNRRIHQEAEAAGRLCNIADQPGLCNFVLPAVVSQGDLIIAVSTAGQSPAFAKHLRKELQSQFGPEYGRFLELMGAIRRQLLAADHAPEAHKPLFERLVAAGLPELIKNENRAAIDRLLAKVLGPEYRYAALMGEG